MNKMICALMATAIIGSFAVETTIPVSAAIVHPLQLKGDMKGDNAVEDVRYDRGGRHRSHGGHSRNYRRGGHGHYNRGHYNRGHYRRPAYGHYNRNYYRGPRHVHGGYWRGYRGYRDYRPGYRYYNGWWYPAAAFVGGAIIGSAVANQPTYYAQPSYGNAHVQWCYNRYRSYRASDNTFQPNSGPRRQCVSPYG
ncbi:BA14K family protein [Mesorhizobium sp. ANAO-SY3R2]|uniref:BA14K family protein n=1 Tax=Mesorhizobium sp. ANAO-SY3R2 TaxID=3166644 RepID=UPI00366BCC5C